MAESSAKIYELVDTTDEEIQYHCGFWLSLDAALAEIVACKNPDDYDSPLCADGDGFEIELREHAEGWGDRYRVVYSEKWARVYDDEADDYLWLRYASALRPRG